MHKVTRTFLELVKIYSPSLKEEGIIKYIRNRFSGKRAKLSYDACGEKAGISKTGNLTLLVPGVKGRRSLFFCAHMDTVTAEGRIVPVIRKGEVRSATGTILGADNKASIAIMLEAAELLLSMKKKPGYSFGDVYFIFTIAEEIGLEGAKLLDTGRIGAASGFVFDSAGEIGRVVLCAPSQNYIKITVKGRAAHAGLNPELGINAIKSAAEMIAAMKSGRLDRGTTANIGTIKGGKATNIVPDRAEMEYEIRSLDDAKLEKKTSDLITLVERISRKNGTSCEIEVNREYTSYRHKKNSALIKGLKKALVKNGVKPRLGSSGGGSDTNIFNERGIPSVNLSVGMMNPHSPEEYIKTRDLETGLKITIDILNELSR